MRKVLFLSLVIAISLLTALGAAETVSHMVESPGQTNRFELVLRSESPRMVYRVVRNGRELISNSPIHVRVAEHGDLSEGSAIMSASTHQVNDTITPVWGKAKSMANRYNSLTVNLESSTHVAWKLEVRAYDDAITFRYVIPRQEKLSEVEIESETTGFRLADNPDVLHSVCKDFFTPHESTYATTPLDRIAADQLLEQPFLATWKNAAVAISEARLRHYPGMYLTIPGPGESTLRMKHAPLPENPKVVARGKTPFVSPWRVIMLADKAGELHESNVHVCLNDPPQGDFSWFTPGKTTWHWWNGDPEKDFSFKPGLNFETHKCYLDFCARNGIAYHAIVCGTRDTTWYFQSKEGFFPGPDTNVLEPRPGLELPRILAYAKEKGVGIRLWIHWKALEPRLEEAFALYHKWGVKGLMVDFLDRNDQEMVAFCERVLKSAQKNHLHIQFHGSYPPSGEHYTFPNLINREGALNLEYLKWGDLCSPDHTVKVAYTRALAGPTDYHLGGFQSVPRSEFKPRFIDPVVLGTRCHHLALYVVLLNAVPQVCDTPPAYEGQPGFEFLRSVPTAWDETKFLCGEVGEYLVLARRKGSAWYLGGITNWTAREIEVPLDFLGGKPAEITIWRDTNEAAEKPNELIKEERISLEPKSLRARLGEGGGFVAVIRLKE